MSKVLSSSKDDKVRGATIDVYGREEHLRGTLIPSQQNNSAVIPNSEWKQKYNEMLSSINQEQNHQQTSGEQYVIEDNELDLVTLPLAKNDDSLT